MWSDGFESGPRNSCSVPFYLDYVDVGRTVVSYSWSESDHIRQCLRFEHVRLSNPGTLPGCMVMVMLLMQIRVNPDLDLWPH